MESTSGSTSQMLQRVLNTPELLELILARLPMGDLLLAQRVCKKWQTSIQLSPRLQEALFFKPSTITGRMSPITEQMPPAEQDNSRNLSAGEFQRNPLLESKFPVLSTKPPLQFRLFTAETLLAMPWNKDDQSRAAYACKEASWRRMLLLQPASAISEVDILYMTHGMGGDGLSDNKNVIDPLEEGLRMGWVYDRCCEIAFASSASFVLRWHMLKSEELWAPKLTMVFRRVFSCMPDNKVHEDWKPMWSKSYTKFEPEYQSHAWALLPRLIMHGRGSAPRVPSSLLYDKEDVLPPLPKPQRRNRNIAATPLTQPPLNELTGEINTLPQG